MEVAMDLKNTNTKTIEDLPQELMCLVFGNLKSPEDLKNAWNTCILWNRILDEHKQEFLLPNILPHLQAYLSKSDIYNCRMVSKSWKQGFDSFLRTTKSRTFMTSISSFDDFQKFSSVMRHPEEGSPFPSGRFMFGQLLRDRFYEEMAESESNQLYRMFPFLASKFGNHIYQLIYIFGGSCSVSPHQIQAIPKYLLNLRDLMFVEELGGTAHPESITEIIEGFPTEGLNMKKLITFRCFITYGVPVMKAILKQYSSQLEQLNCFGSCLNAETFSDNQLSNLKILKVWRCNFFLFSYNYSILSGLSLKVLKLEFHDDFIEEGKLERLMNALPKSIINLVLRYLHDSRPNTVLNENFENLQPCPNLKCLTISSRFLNNHAVLTKFLIKLGGGIEHLKFSCQSYIVDFHRDLNSCYANWVAKVLFEKCSRLQSIEFQKPSNPDFLYNSEVKIHRISRSNAGASNAMCNT
ncbi:unnamed protein product [Orchesella dallaii]|uniref:F-box domain-containing protein n=1 Tax=Orchesella dallaii TaxID=48710 RepID=A0ABP1PVR5_9HEXA